MPSLEPQPFNNLNFNYMLTLGSPNFHLMLTSECKLTNKYSIGKLRIGKTTYEVIRLLTK